MPCWEFFEQQSKDYQDTVLPPKVKPRVAVEAGAGFGWERWIGRRGSQVVMHTYGASAPPKVNMEKFGFTAQKVMEAAKAAMARWDLFDEVL